MQTIGNRSMAISMMTYITSGLLGYATFLDKTEDAILELARAGMSVAQFCDVIPEEPDVIRASLMGLVEMGVLIPR